MFVVAWQWFFNDVDDNVHLEKLSDEKETLVVKIDSNDIGSIFLIDVYNKMLSNGNFVPES